ncbi:MAG TPA: cytochrome C [Bacteroidetes bacterium]|jgi:hypothetical protein|nr:cytochrome C [Bacteroidota bacterium]
MKIVKRIALVMAGVFIILQFIRPTKNITDGPPTSDISTKLNVPPDVLGMLRTSCYDCHSNTTRYPWYAEVQPVGWLLNYDIQGGKQHLNFSEFATYPLRRQFIKFQQIGEQVDGEEMPLPKYLVMHADARLSPEQRERLVAWTYAMTDSMKATYPPDSLARRK